MIVYVVTSGEYSDYSIEAVFSTKEKAEAYKADMEWVGSEKADIEEWEVDTLRERRALEVGMTREGETYMVRKTLLPRGHEIIFNGKETLLLNVVATEEEERAVKVTNELRTRLIALSAWHYKGEKIPCPSCNGRGLKGEVLCPVCKGHGKILREELVNELKTVKETEANQ